MNFIKTVVHLAILSAWPVLGIYAAMFWLGLVPTLDKVIPLIAL